MIDKEKVYQKIKAAQLDAEKSGTDPNNCIVPILLDTLSEYVDAEVRKLRNSIRNDVISRR